MTVENSGGMSRLKRSQKPSIQAAAAATRSCRKTRRRRLYMGARPAQVDPYSDRTHHHHSRADDAGLHRGALGSGIERRGRAKEHQHIAQEGGATMSNAKLHQALVIVAAMRLPDALAAHESLQERECR